MKDRLIMCILVLLFNSNIGSTQITENLHKVYVPMWAGLGYGYELSISDNVTLNPGLDMRGYIGDDDFALDNFVFSPRASLETRSYYNLKRRFDKGKRVKFNSANFVSLDLSYEFPIGWHGLRDVPQNTIRILPTWGLRRQIKNHFIIDLGFYVGYKIIRKTNPTEGRWNPDSWPNRTFDYGLNVIFAYVI